MSPAEARGIFFVYRLFCKDEVITVFKEMRIGVKFGIGVLLIAGLFSGAWWYSSLSLERVEEEAEILEEGWLPGVFLLRHAELFAHDALCEMRALPGGGAGRIDAAHGKVEKTLAALGGMKEHAARRNDLGALSRHLDEAEERARSIVGSLKELRSVDAEAAKGFSDSQGALTALRAKSREILTEQRGILERWLRSGGTVPENALAAAGGLQTLADAVDELERAFAQLLAEEGRERVDAVWEAHSRLRVALRDVRMAIFDAALLEDIDFMVEGMDSFQGAFDASLRSSAARRDLEWRAAAAAESLLDLVGGVRDTAFQESLALSKSIGKRASEASRTLSLSMQAAALGGVLFALWLAKGK